MRKFSEVYDKAKDVFANQKFESAWHKYLTEQTHASKLFKAEWLDQAHARCLDNLRHRLVHGPETTSGGGIRGANRVAAVEIWKAAGDDTDHKRKERAATLKLMKHLYLVSSRGAQSVWVYSPPKEHTNWVYDELNVGDVTAEAALRKEEEIFTEKQKLVMAHALQFAHTWSQAASAKLAGPDDTTKAVVRSWFADQTSTAETLATAAATLADGFKKMATMANSACVVLSDDPVDRREGGQKWFDNYRALVYPSETQPVIYLEGLWLKEANGVTNRSDKDQMWNLSRTIIHELSHKAARTTDICYAGHTLNPDNSRLKRNGKKLDAEKALINADSWAYFCVDLAGVLPSSNRQQVLALAA